MLSLFKIKDGNKYYLNMKNKIFQIILVFFASFLLFGCQYKDDPVEYPYKQVLFTYQEYNRQVVVGEGLQMKVGFVFAGLNRNDRDRKVNFTINNDLITNEKQSPLPSDYYTFDNSSQITIKKGTLKAYMPVKLDSAKLVNDPKALTGEYILAVQITDADVDTIPASKDYTLISISYQGHQYGNYRYNGHAVNSVTKDTLKYSYQFTATNSIRQLQTVGPNKFRVYADQTGNMDPAKGTYSMIITVPVEGSGNVLIEPDTEYLTDVPVSPDGESTYDEATKTFTLRYKYTKDGEEWKAEDVMVFRNRIRDDQGDGRVLYEWRGF